MSHLQQVEQFMNALGQPVRYQPIDEIKTYEVIDRLDVIINKLTELGVACGIDPVNYQRWTFQHMTAKVKPEKMLQSVAELEYLVLSLYHSFGLNKYSASAFTEVHNSNLTRRWPDGFVHREPSGKLKNPPGYVAPDMTKVIAQHRQMDLFDTGTKVKTVHEIPAIDPDGDVHSNE